jgi:hypothetical protein
MILKLDNWSVKGTTFKCKVQGAKCKIICTLHFSFYTLDWTFLFTYMLLKTSFPFLFLPVFSYMLPFESVWNDS